MATATMKDSNQSHKYLSTRGGSYDYSFEDVVLKGLADDGGLFIPQEIPNLPSDWQTNWRDLSFEQLALEIFSLYIADSEIPRHDLQKLIDRSYASFRHPERTPLTLLNRDTNLYVLELFHGPTFAFKDVALQFLGNLFEYFLDRKNKKSSNNQPRAKLTVVGATSGDTGSAAIYGLRGKKDVSVYILFPQGKVSPIQEAQMTSVLDDNVHNLAVKGTFDDCQDIVKSLFSDVEFNQKHSLGAINSINWARILAQVVYYFYSYFALQRDYSLESKSPLVHFVVPTGNFGDVLAGYFAKRMGLPFHKLVVSTNENDILDRFWKSGTYEIKRASKDEAEGGIAADGAKAHLEGVKETLSPAMDILVSSNFERLLWFLALEATTDSTATQRDRHVEAGRLVQTWMKALKENGHFTVPNSILSISNRDFTCERVSDDETVNTIRAVYDYTSKTGKPYVIDPHTSVGITAASRFIDNDSDIPKNSLYVCLATAHPAKFSHAVDMSLQNKQSFSFSSIMPKEFHGLLDAEKKVINIPASKKELVKEQIEAFSRQTDE